MSLNPILDKAVSIQLGDTPSIDSFSRTRVSSPVSLFVSSQVYNAQTTIWETILVGGGTSTHRPNEALSELAVGTASGDSSARQTSRYFTYVPGKSQLIAMTGIFAAGKANLRQRIGAFDARNGLFFQLNGTTLSVVRRTYTSGTAVDNEVVQSSWNLDKLDGTGPSGITLDLTKAQIFIIDFQWLAVGRVRFGFDLDGIVVYCHEMLHANVLSTVYMSTGTLPLRYEITNTGITGSASTLKQICASVASEGGLILPGLEFSASKGITTTAVTTRRPIFAIRQKTTFNSIPNQRAARLLNMWSYATTNAAFLEVAHVHDPAAITATWADVSTISSSIEYSTDISAITPGAEHIIASGAIGVGVGSATAIADIKVEDLNDHAYISQNVAANNSQVFVVYATSFTGTSNVSCGLTWLETD